MSLSDLLGKIGDAVMRPFEVIEQYAKEPLRAWEHRRGKDAAEHAAKMAVYERTEISRVLAEIEQLQKDKDFERSKKVLEAIEQYQQKLTRLNLNAVQAIGEMQIELRERAHELIHEKTQSYKEMQAAALDEAGRDLKKIESDFEANPRAREILERAVDQRLGFIISAAADFIEELKRDISQINASITLLTERGQASIEEHLGRIQGVSQIRDLTGGRKAPCENDHLRLR